MHVCMYVRVYLYVLLTFYCVYIVIGLHRVDSYRIWESLAMGSIPIVESSALGTTLERTFSLLPVLVITDFLKVVGKIDL